MSISAYYTNLIDSSEKFIKEKQDENENLLAQEDAKKEELEVTANTCYRLKREMRGLLGQINSFLRENGGIFSLNDEQKTFYQGLLAKRGNLSNNIFDSTKLKYGLQADVTSLGNHYFSNSLTIFNETLDVSDYRNQQDLYSKIENA